MKAIQHSCQQKLLSLTGQACKPPIGIKQQLRHNNDQLPKSKGNQDRILPVLCLILRLMLSASLESSCRTSALCQKRT